MKKSRIISAIVTAALAVTNLTAFTAMNVSAEEVDLDGTYHAYIGVQTQNFMFRNAYDDATYGYGIVADDGTVWFDQITAWDGPTAVNKPTTFNDVEIAGNGSYTVSMSDFDLGDEEYFNLLFVSTDIPLNDTIKVTDVKIKMDGKTCHTFDEAFMDPDAKVMMKWLAINIWNNDLGGKDGLFGYMMPTKDIEISFNISGFNYDKAAEEVPEETAAVTEAETTAAPTEAETTAAETEAVTTIAANETTAAETTTTAAAAAASTSDVEESSNYTILIVVIIAAVVVVAGVVIVIMKKKS